MLLTLETTHQPATDLGYLLHKHPDRLQSFDAAYGKVHVLYPVAEESRCQVAVLLDVDSIGLVRRKGRRPAGNNFSLDQYVNDRPYVASSLFSVALNAVFSTAMNGRCKERPNLVDTPLSLRANIAVVASRGGEEMIHRLFDPLGYNVTATQHPLDEQFVEWGSGPYFTITLRNTIPVQHLLQHLYVLLPVLDNDKHYWVTEEEIEKLLMRGKTWLANHSDKDLITTRYLRYQKRFTRDALARLTVEEEPDIQADDATKDLEEDTIERPLSLNEQRMGAVVAALTASGATSVIDLGCGEGKLLRDLLKVKQFAKITGVDVSVRSLERASQKLRLDRLPDVQRKRITLLHGSLMYRDARLEGFEAAACVEVIEHIEPSNLPAFERVVFEFAQPRTVIVTTPNIEYNVQWETLPAGKLRHRDHRFEWTRAEFQQWATQVAETHGYAVRFLPIGPVNAEVGSPTQMGIFER